MASLARLSDRACLLFSSILKRPTLDWRAIHCLPNLYMPLRSVPTVASPCSSSGRCLPPCVVPHEPSFCSSTQTEPLGSGRPAVSTFALLLAARLPAFVSIFL